jgi:hypothetical protein
VWLPGARSSIQGVIDLRARTARTDFGLTRGPPGDMLI